MPADELQDYCTELLEEEIERAKIALNPRLWPKDLDERWHKALPDVYKAFGELSRFVFENDG